MVDIHHTVYIERLKLIDCEADRESDRYRNMDRR
jgi:hypothetical protein